MREQGGAENYREVCRHNPISPILSGSKTQVEDILLAVMRFLSAFRAKTESRSRKFKKVCSYFLVSSLSPFRVIPTGSAFWSDLIYDL